MVRNRAEPRAAQARCSGWRAATRLLWTIIEVESGSGTRLTKGINRINELMEEIIINGEIPHKMTNVCL